MATVNRIILQYNTAKQMAGPQLQHFRVLSLTANSVLGKTVKTELL